MARESTAQEIPAKPTAAAANKKSAMSSSTTAASKFGGRKAVTETDLTSLTAKLALATKAGKATASSSQSGRLGARGFTTSTPESNTVPPPPVGASSSGGWSTIHPQSSALRATPPPPTGPWKTMTTGGGPEEVPIGAQSLQQQEQALIQDLLYVLLGIDGKYVRKIPSYMTSLLSMTSLEQVLFELDPDLDASLRSLASRFLPLATYYAFISHNTEEAMSFHHGTVVHAMAAQTRHFLHDYHLFVAHLETQTLYSGQPIGLQQWWSWTVDVNRTMRVLAELWFAIVFHAKNPAGEAGRWLRGGEAINVLFRYMTMHGGDQICRDVVKSVLDKAVLPYIKIVDTWSTRGEIRDPYDEFMILEKASVRKEDLNAEYNDAYWETRYRIRGDTRGTEMPASSLEELRLAFQAPTETKDPARNESVPFFLKSIEDKVLFSGKYLNVIRECGRHVMDEQLQRQLTMVASGGANPMSGYCPCPMMALYCIHKNARCSVVSRVEAAYKSANAKVLSLLFDEHHLVQRLRSVKHYFFMDQSDFMVHFLDSAQEELRKPAREVSMTKLQSLLDLVLRNPSSFSAASTDPYKEDVKVDLSSMGLTEQLLRIISVTGALEEENPQVPLSSEAAPEGRSARALTGLTAFTLDYKVPFPVSLVISRKSLTRYQIIFRHLFTCKYAERLLCTAWSDLQMGYKKYLKWRRDPGTDVIDQEACVRLERVLNRAYNIRSQMLLFVQNLIYYIFNEVLEPRWHDLEAHLAKAETVDAVLQGHADFLDTCLKECMLTNRSLLMCQMQLLNVCGSFATQTDRFMRAFLVSPVVVLSNPIRSPLETYERVVDKAEELFQADLLRLMESVQFLSAVDGDHQMPHLAARLDFSGYYAGEQSQQSQQGIANAV